MEQGVTDRFWKRVPVNVSNSECWNWTGGCQSDGYGWCSRMLAHRVSWIIHRGDITNDLCVCHRCDNPKCVNPNHLFLGTHTENMRDMVAKGRGVSPGHPGERNPHAKLTENDISEILFSEKKAATLAERYGVNKTTIYNIKSGKRWPKAEARKIVSTAAASSRNGRE